MRNTSRIGKYVGVILAVFVVVSLVTSLGAAAYAISDHGGQDIDPADEVYITDDGAVAVYTGDDVDAEVVTAEFGADVATGLVNGVFEVEDDDVDDIDGQIGVELRESVFTGEGDLTVTDVEELDSFTLTAEGEHSQDASFVRSEFDGVLTGDQPLPAAESAGDLSLTADRLSIDADVQLGAEPTGDEVAELISLTIREDGDGFAITGEERQEIRFGAERWDSEENATIALQQRFGSVAESFGGSADVTLRDHDFTEGDDRTPASAHVEYTVEMTDVRGGMTDFLVEAVAEEGDDVVGDTERDALRESLNELVIDEVSVSFIEGTQGEVSVGTNIVLENYQSSVTAALDIAEDEGTVDEDQVEEVQETFDAQAASGLEQTISWGVTTEPAEGVDEPGASAVTGELAYETENWDAYMQERYGDDPEMTEATFDATLSAEDETVDADFSFSVDHGDFMDTAVDEAIAELRGEDDIDEDELAFLEAFDDSDIQVAKSDIVFGSDTVEVRAAGQFDNLSAFTRASDAPGVESVSQIYGEAVNDDSGEVYVYITDERLTEETVRETAFVGEETTVHAADEWDREFPRMDTDEVANYLGVDIASDDDGDEDSTDADDDGPGFGIAVAVAGLLGLALLARRAR